MPPPTAEPSHTGSVAPHDDDGTTRGVEVRAGVPLAPRCTMGVGGPAQLLALAQSVEDVAAAHRLAQTEGLPLIPLGAGSNVVFNDAGVHALILEQVSSSWEQSTSGARVRLTVDAGHDWDALVQHCTSQDLVGLECLSGIPGRVGAAPIQNVGAYGQEVSDVIDWVEAYDLEFARVQRFAREECDFRYRDSMFKSAHPGRFVVVRVSFLLEQGATPVVRYPELARALEAENTPASPTQIRRQVLHLRASKSMLLNPADPNARSCGSFFVNPIVPQAQCDALLALYPDMPHFPAYDGARKLSGGWLIEHAGLSKGTQRGRARVSTKHALSLVALDGATAKDVIVLAEEVRVRVQQKFNVPLVVEPNFIGYDTLVDRLPQLID